jgi:hypothetical protein
VRVKLTYFKGTGKYYDASYYDSDLEQLFEIWDEVREMSGGGCLPGLVLGATEFHVLIEVPEHPHNHPRLILV